VPVISETVIKYAPTLRRAWEYVGAFSTPIGEPPLAITESKLPGIQLEAGFQAIDTMLSTTSKYAVPIEIALIGDLKINPNNIPIVPYPIVQIRTFTNECPNAE
jgi:hypothetical protein